MPETLIIPSSSQGSQPTLKPTTTFTGDVYLDIFHMDDTTTITNVTFTPCARTYWHTHEEGQFLKVVAGSGWICDKGAEPHRIKVGDLIWAPPGTTHWHGADEGSPMTHFVVALGKTTWHDAVTDEQYRVKKD
ncbi:RmlC-like cupin domain-containing protein [Penicillium hispanicum]|uniref:RmlC-like cupin domain-containing protein n=1 Tax=Penicillium hispanicum TaxID=1080232 RepID=UPI002540DB24|nr:RmlC-like cupin domain-containing protein [Penicillium hispanicum]KAJ5577477.1 RmlC-like cupin domain-containing protein [Penicillium hispanicum]